MKGCWSLFRSRAKPWGAVDGLASECQRSETKHRRFVQECWGRVGNEAILWSHSWEFLNDVSSLFASFWKNPPFQTSDYHSLSGHSPNGDMGLRKPYEMTFRKKCSIYRTSNIVAFLTLKALWFQGSVSNTVGRELHVPWELSWVLFEIRYIGDRWTKLSLFQ